MLTVHLNDGRTLQFDGNDPSQLARWLEMAASEQFQQSVTGITITSQGVSYSLPKPKDFKQVFMSAEIAQPDETRRFKGAERIVCTADDTSAILTVYNSQRAARVDLTRSGRQMFNPLQTKRGKP